MPWISKHKLDRINERLYELENAAYVDIYRRYGITRVPVWKILKLMMDELDMEYVTTMPTEQIVKKKK